MNLHLVLFFSLVVLATTSVCADPERDAQSYVAAVAKINERHARRPGDTTEKELAERIPRSSVGALARLLKEDSSEEVSDALVRCGEAALDLAQLDHFARIRKRLLEGDPEAAAKLGDAVVRERFLVRGIGAFEDGFLEDFASLTDAILNAYDEVFAFEQWSKVPGKKIRIRVHLEEEITRPPHFAPQYRYHSEIDMPVVDAKRFNSPTTKGQMMFYGLCHELGHLIAMWGDRRTQEDHHAWAHYTGVVIVEHMANEAKYKEILSGRGDVRWRSLSLERKKTENTAPPSTDDKAGVMALLIQLHDTAGPTGIGAALNLMDEKAYGHRINRVRYYSFADLKKALKVVVRDREKRAKVTSVFP